MELTPKKIFEEFQNNTLSKSSALELLTSLIENCNDANIRLEGFRNLEKIGLINNRSFKLIENLLVSDSNWQIRSAAAQCITEKFQEKALNPLKWAINYEQVYECIVAIIKSLVELNTIESKSILIDEIKKIKKAKYLLKDSKITNKAFNKDIKKLLKNMSIYNLTHEELADIIINYKTIIALKQKYYNVYYELRDARVIKLDLSDIEFEVRGWQSDFNNYIKDLSDIPGLINLKHLTHLYLSNNQITDIKKLLELPNLSYVHLSNNNLDDEKNVKYIRQMAKKNLKFINIDGNRIANLINIKEFNPEIIIVTKTHAFY